MSTPLSSRASSWKWAGLPAAITFGASIHAFASELLASAEVVHGLSSGREDVELSRVAFSVVSVRVAPPLGFWLFALAVAFSHRFDGRRGARAARVALCALGVPWAVIVFATAGLFVAGPWTMRSVAVFGPAVVIVLVSTALFGLVALAVPHERVRESDTWEVVSARLSYVLLLCFALQMVSGIVYGHGSEVARLAVRLFWLASFGLTAYVAFACVVRLLRSRSSAELRIVLAVVYVGVFAVAPGMPVPKFGALLCLAALILREVTQRVAPSGHPRCPSECRVRRRLPRRRRGAHPCRTATRMTREKLGLDDESRRAQLHHPGQTERANGAEVFRSENGYAGAGHSSTRFGKRQLAMRSALLCGMSLMMSACDAFVFVPVNVSDCRTGAVVSGAVVTATLVPRGAAAGAAGATKSVTGMTDQHGDVRLFIHHPAPSDVEIVVRAVEFSATRRSVHVDPRQAAIRVCMLRQGG